MLQAEQSSSSLLPGVIYLNKKKYAVNLLWDDVPDDKQYKSIIKNRLKLLGSNLYTISRNLTGKQYAIADKNIGHQKNNLVLASCIDNNGRSVCALCQHENLWLLLAVDNNGYIVIDKASYKQDDIIQTFYSIYNQNSWDDVVCPVELGIPGSSELSVHSLINKKGVRLYSAGIDRFYPLAVVGCIFIICGLTAMFFRDTIVPEDKNTAIDVESQPPEEIDLPWGGYSLPSDLIKLCADNVSSKYLKSSSIPGWNVDPVVICNDSGDILLSVKKDFGLKIWISNGIYKEFFKGELPKISNIKDSSADITWTLNPSPKKYEKARLQPDKIKSMLDSADDIKKYIQDTSEYYFIPLQLDTSQQINGNITEIKFSMSLQNEPTMVLPILSRIKNLVVNQCLFDAGNGTWEVKGTFWGK